MFLFISDLASKVGHKDEGSSRKEKHGHYSTDHLNLAVNRGTPGMAVQFRLGILAERRSRIDPLDRYNSRFDGTPLKYRFVSANGHLCDEEPPWDRIP